MQLVAHEQIRKLLVSKVDSKIFEEIFINLEKVDAVVNELWHGLLTQHRDDVKVFGIEKAITMNPYQVLIKTLPEGFDFHYNFKELGDK